MRVPVLLVLLGCKAPATPVQQAADDDGDGFDTNSDCDDTDPGVNPDAIDLGGDGLDRNCDGEDGGRLPLDGLPFFVEGREADDRFGGAVAACDLNDDGQDDLVTSSYGLGSIHVFLGPLAPSRPVPSEAGLQLSVPDGVGYYLRCGDADGDGRDDLLWTVPDTTLDPRFRIAVLQQPSGGFTGSEQPVFLDLPTTMESFWAELVDLDGDGRDTLLVVVDWGDEATEPPIYLVDGRDLTFDGVAIETVATPVSSPQTRVYGPTVLFDLDGPGDDGVMFCGNAAPFCRIVSDFAQLDLELDRTTTLATTTGGRALVMDLDGSGTPDDVVFARWGEPGDLKVAFGGLGQEEPAWDEVVSVPEGWSGKLSALDDLDGDGVDDLQLVVTRDDISARIISGAALADPGARVGSVSMLTIDAPPGFVNRTITADLDGDGLRDPVIGYGGGDDLGGLGVLLSSGL